MAQGDTHLKAYKSRLIGLIGSYFGDHIAVLYQSVYANMPIDFVEKSSEKLLTEYIGRDRARALVDQAKDGHTV